MRSPRWGVASRISVACLFLLLAGCGGNVEKDKELPAIVDVWDYSDPEGSRVRFEELAREAEAAGEETYRAEIMTQVARTHGLQGNFDEANATLDAVAAMPAAEHPRVRLRLALERGRTLRSSGDAESARPLFVEAWELGKENGDDVLACDAAHMVAIVVPLQEAIEWTARGRDLALSSDDPTARYWLGALHNNLGWAYYEAEVFDGALTQFQLSHESYSEREDKQVEQLLARYAIGKALRALGRNQEAVETQNQVRLAFEARSEDDGYVYEELAEGYLALGNEDEGCKAAQKAFEILSGDGWFVENEPERLERMRNLGSKCE
jgi:tetratricopeptide (TPR) repeat protein